MVPKKNGFFINNPVFLKIKRKFDWRTLRREELVKFVFINERIVEIPFVAASLSALPSGSRVIDLGCAESIMPMNLVAMGFHVTGVDFRPYPYHLPNFIFSRADILKLPFADGSFDACTCVSTLEHIGIGRYDDPLADEKADFKAMEQILRVLKPGGILVLTVPFGTMFRGELQRVYDSVRLNGLLKGFCVEKKMFYSSSKPEGVINNFWDVVSEETAAQVPGGDRTEGVCLVRARKA